MLWRECVVGASHVDAVKMLANGQGPWRGLADSAGLLVRELDFDAVGQSAFFLFAFFVEAKDFVTSIAYRGC